MSKIKPLIEWNDKLSVKIDEIDEQHKILVSLINSLYESIVTQTTDLEVNNILEQLVQYTIIHFAVEESLMRIFHYPEHDAHKKHHEELTNQVISLRTKVKNKETEISMKLLNFLRSWLTNHIMVEDQLYSPFFLQQGIKPTWHNSSWRGKIWKLFH